MIVAIKAAKAIAPEHQAQSINTVKATGIEVGLRIHFGNPKLETKRFNDTSESVSELKSSCKSCPSMFIHFVRKHMHTCLYQHVRLLSLCGITLLSG